MNSDALPIIAWDNKIPDGTLSSAGDTAGSPVENVGDWRPYLRWKSSVIPSAMVQVDAGPGEKITASMLVLAGHNFSDIGATFQLLGADIWGAWTVVYALTTPPTGNHPIAAVFPEASFRYWQILFSGAESDYAQIGIWFLGPYIQFPDYPLPGFDPFAKKITADSTLGQTGELLGASKRFLSWDITANFGDLDRDWVSLWIKPLENEHYPKPFFWIFDIENHPTDIYLLRNDKPEMIHPVDANLAEVILEMSGRMEP